MTRVIVSDPAFFDIFQIIQDLERDAGSCIALKYKNKFDALFFGKLLEFPEMYPLRPKIGALVRASVLYPYVVYYEYDYIEKTVVIMRVLHGRRRITEQLLKENSF